MAARETTDGGRMGTLTVRVITGVLVLIVALSLIWIPGARPAFALFIALAAGIGLYEFFALARARELVCEPAGGIVAGVCVIFSAYAGSLLAVNSVLYAACFLVAVLHILRGAHSLPGLAASVFGIVYIGWLASHVLLLHSFPGVGAGLVTLLIGAVTLSDTGAYFAGSLLGTHKLAPKVSPNKTWEGSLGGLAAAVVGMAIVGALNVQFGWSALPDLPIAYYVLAGAALSVAGQFGDLAESFMKRDAGVKDSGALLPGHGGILDRCDGVLFAAPVLYYSFVVLNVMR